MSILFDRTKDVKKAALVLDKEYPGWYKRVDTETLNMASPFRCILGQGGNQVYRPEYRYTGSRSDLYTKGYNFGPGVFADPRVTPYWMAEIEARREADHLPPDGDGPIRVLVTKTERVLIGAALVLLPLLSAGVVGQ